MGETAVDWAAVRPRPGHWTCPHHGVIDPARDGVVPYCPGAVGGRRCLRIAYRARLDRRGRLMYVPAQPSHCGGPDRHPLTAGAVLLGWTGCRCTPMGGHRSWTCGCGDPQSWPPHDPDVPG